MPTVPEYLDRLPPHNIEAEQALLGAILLDNKILPRLETLIDQSDFYRSNHKEIYAAILAHRADQPDAALDLLTLRDALEQRGKLEYIGGPAYLAALIDVTPTAANFEGHAGIVRELAKKRRLLAEHLRSIEALYDPRKPFQESFLNHNEQIRSLDFEPVRWVRTVNGRPRGIVEREYVCMLEDLGFRQTNYNGGRNFGRILDGGRLVQDVKWYKNTCITVKDTVKDTFAAEHPALWELLLKEHKFDHRVMTSLNRLDHGEFVRDDSETCYLFFQNGAVKIHPDRVFFLQYQDLPGYVWQNSVARREYHGRYNADDCCLDLDAEQRAGTQPDFQRFLSLCSSGRVTVDDQTDHFVNNQPVFEYAFGHNLWQYNDPINMKCTIDIDNDPGELPEGRRGKGLFTHALRVMRGVTDEDAGEQTYVVVHEDGKAFTGGFKFQRVHPTTRILIIDDVDEKSVTFDQFFSAITEGTPSA